MNHHSGFNSNSSSSSRYRPSNNDNHINNNRVPISYSKRPRSRSKSPNGRHTSNADANANSSLSNRNTNNRNNFTDDPVISSNPSSMNSNNYGMNGDRGYGGSGRRDYARGPSAGNGYRRGGTNSNGPSGINSLPMADNLNHINNNSNNNNPRSRNLTRDWDRRDNYSNGTKDTYLGKAATAAAAAAVNPSNSSVPTLQLNNITVAGPLVGATTAQAGEQEGRKEQEQEQEQDDDMWPEVINVPYNQWIFTKEDLKEKTPSRLAKSIPYKDELAYRAKAVQRVVEFSAGTKLARRTVIAASVFLNRYYMFNDFFSFDYKQVVATCVFIATKSEENLKSIKTIALQLAKMIKPGVPVEELDNLIWKNIDAIKSLENKILKDLRFDLIIEMPFDVFDEVLDVDDASGINTAVTSQLTPQQRKQRQREKELQVKQFYWFAEVAIYCPVYILYNAYELAAAAYVLTMLKKKEKIGKFFVQKHFGVGLAKINDIIAYMKECFDHLKTVDVKMGLDPQLSSFDYSMDDLLEAVDGGGDEEDVKAGRNEFKKEIRAVDDKLPIAIASGAGSSTTGTGVPAIAPASKVPAPIASSFSSGLAANADSAAHHSNLASNRNVPHAAAATAAHVPGIPKPPIMHHGQNSRPNNNNSSNSNTMRNRDSRGGRGAPVYNSHSHSQSQSNSQSNNQSNNTDTLQY